MTSFTRNWNSSYEAIPANAEGARLGARRIRELKQDIRERLAVDHSWVGDGNDGYHMVVTLIPQSTDPGTLPNGRLYAKKVGSGANESVELFFKSSKGVITQMSYTQGTAAGIILPGTILPIGNLHTADMTPHYLHCDGAAVSRTTYSDLFAAIATLWGAGDGVSTFNVPDLRGRTLIGGGTGSGLTARSTGQKMGVEKHELAIAELPSHTHGIAALFNATASPGGVAYPAVDTQNAIGGTGHVGSNQAHENMQPSAVVHYVIKT